MKVRIRTNPAMLGTPPVAELDKIHLVLKDIGWRIEYDERKKIEAKLATFVAHNVEPRYLVETKHWLRGWRVYAQVSTYKQALDLKIELTTGQVVHNEDLTL